MVSSHRSAVVVSPFYHVFQANPLISFRSGFFAGNLLFRLNESAPWLPSIGKAIVQRVVRFKRRTWPFTGRRRSTANTIAIIGGTLRWTRAIVDWGLFLPRGSPPVLHLNENARLVTDEMGIIILGCTLGKSRACLQLFFQIGYR